MCLLILISTRFKNSVLIAIAVPNLKDLIPLVGITCGSMLALIFPASMDTITFLPRMLEKRRAELAATHAEGCLLTMPILWVLVRNGFLIALGLFSLVVGLESAIRSLVEGK